jgi:photosystem II stability/assembly factor-like uncharacterized protein
MMNRKTLSLIGIIGILLAACGNNTPPQPTAIPPTEAPILVPTFPPPTDTPTAQVTETATPVTNPINPLASGTEVAITTINMMDAKRGWGIGTSATDPNDHILLTADGGTSWKDVTPHEGTDPAGGKLATAFFKGADIAWVIYSSNVIQSPPGNAHVWKTTDGGTTWSPSQPIPPSAEMEFFSPGFFSFPDTQHGWLLVHAGAGMSHDYIYIYGTTDGGSSWQVLVDPVASDQAGTGPSMGLWKTGMAFTDAQKGWLTYENGGVAPGLTLYGTVDGGNTWAPQSLPAPASQPDLFSNDNYSCGAYGLAFLDAQQGSMVVTCLMGSGDLKKSWLYQTADVGQSWQSSLLPAPGGDLQMIDENNGYYVGGNIFRTTDSGKSWVTVIPVKWGGQPDFISLTTGWIVAVNDAERALVQTTNSAVNWAILKTVITK